MSTESLTAARTLGLASLLVGIALLTAPALGHVDDTDALLYRTVARHMVEDHAWFDLRYLPHLYPHFREHLPFGFWPMAVAIRLFGESALPFVGWIFSVGCLVIVWRLADALYGPAGATVAVLVLGTTDSFFANGAAARLDPPLLFFSMASAAVVLTRPLRWRDWMLASSLTAAAVLVKGPFGGIPLMAAVGARAWSDKSWATLRNGVIAGVVSTLPLVAFLAADRWLGDGSWWTGYVRTQLLASATGARTDGDFSVLYPLHAVRERFWPGLPIVIIGLVLSLRASPPRVLK